MFRWLTAGESHGRALVAICEGVPAGVRVTTEDVAAALARRRAGYGRGARMTFEQDEVELTGGRPARPHARRPDRDQDRATPNGPSGRRSCPPTRWTGDAGRPGQERAADQAPARARRPGRHAEVRPRRRPPRPRAGQRAGDGRPGRARRGGQAPAQPGPRHRDPQPRGRDRPGQGPRRRRAGPGRRGRHRRRPGALLRPGDEQGHGGRDRRGPQGRRHAGRGGRGAGLRAAAGARQLHALGPAARRPAGRRADVHPGHQGRRGRRRLHHRRPPRVGGPRRDRGHAAGRRQAHQPGGRHRGRDEHRRGDPAAGRDEAHLHGAAGAGHRGRAAPASRPRRSTSAATSTAVPAAGVVAEAMVALVLAEAAVEKFGGDSVEEMRRNAEAT